MKRIKHSKTIGAVVLGAALLAVGSVGFSAWVIGSGSATSDEKAIGVGVSDVTDNLVTLTSMAFSNTIERGTEQITTPGTTATYYGSTKGKTAVNGAGTTAYVVFGPNPLSAGEHLTDDGTASDWAHMTIQYSFTVSWPAAKSLSLTVASTGTAVSALTSAASSNYIVNPDSFANKALVASYTGASAIAVNGTTTGWAISGSGVVTASERKTETITVTMTWYWGSALGGSSSDPCTAATTAELAATYGANLKTLYTSLSAASNLGLTVTATAA